MRRSVARPRLLWSALAVGLVTVLIMPYVAVFLYESGRHALGDLVGLLIGFGALATFALVGFGVMAQEPTDPLDPRDRAR